MKTKQQVTEEKGQAHQKATQHTSPQERTKTDKTLEPELQDRRFHKSSSQVQDNLKTKFQEHATNKHVMILSCKGVSYGSAISQTLLAATSLDHRCTLVQVTYKNVQDKYKTLQDHSKNRAVKLSTS